MTMNTYPEGLDDLAKEVALGKSGLSLSLCRPRPEYTFTAEQIADFSRAILDALAERGIVWVDAKKQEPVAWLSPYGGVLRRLDTGLERETYTIPLYTHPAAKNRISLSDKWQPTADSINSLPDDLRRYVMELETMSDPAGLVRENIQMRDSIECLQALIDEIKEDKPHKIALRDGGIHREPPHGNSANEAERISACNGYFNLRTRIDCPDRRRVFEDGFDRGYDAAIPGRVALPEGWQPIETAPKDGTHILIGRVGHPWTFAAWWRSDRNHWSTGDSAMDYFAEPTNWMPLPVAPTPPTQPQ